MRFTVSHRLTVLLVVAFSLVLFATPVGVQEKGNGNGLEQRVTKLEVQMTALAQELAAQGGQLAALASQLTMLGNRTTALEVLTQPTFNVTVDCANGQTIGAALTQTSAHTGVVVISILGTCTENVVVTRSATVIRSGASGAEIVAANPAKAVVQFIKTGMATFLGLSGLTVSGGQTGVVADLGTQVQLSGVSVRDNQTGIRADHHSLVYLQNSVVEHNTFGVQVDNGAQAFVTRSTLHDNNDFALVLTNGALASVGSSEITSNHGSGGLIRGAVGLYAGSKLRLANTTISQNAGNGIFAVAGSALWLEDGIVIDGNGGTDISLSDTSVIGKFIVTTGIQITNNGRYGISCSASPGVAQLYGFPPVGHAPTVTGNTMGDYDCPTSPLPR